MNNLPQGWAVYVQQITDDNDIFLGWGYSIARYGKPQAQDFNTCFATEYQARTAGENHALELAANY